LDVNALVARLAEPEATARLRTLVAVARERFSAAQRSAMTVWEHAGAFDAVGLTLLRTGPIDVASVRAQLRHHAARRGEAPSEGELDAVPWLLSQASAKPAVVSALLWSQLRGIDPRFRSHLLQFVCERAGVPRLRRRVTEAELVASGDLPAMVAWFGDRIVEDACTWIEQAPPPLDDEATLAAQAAAVEAARAGAQRIEIQELAGFAQRAAAFLVHLSVRGLDPLGFPLGREVQLEQDPPLPRRLEIAGWAQRSGHLVALRGRMFVIGIPVHAPWPLRLELLAVELGRGACGGLGLLLRLHGGGGIAVTEAAPVLLCFPGEPPEERGPRFERWLSAAYPQAAQQWQAWS
jgi:hypothetical protein